MLVTEALAKIRSTWLFKISHRLARGEGVRHIFEQQLALFYDRLVQSVDTGDPGWMDIVLDHWAEGRTETELKNRETSLPVILDQMLLITFEIAHENLEEHDALEVIGALLPVFTHAFEYTTRKENELLIAHIENELDKARLTLERLDKSKSDFIAIAAHELKTPLTLIEGYTAMLREQFPDRERQLQVGILLQGIDNGTHRLREIVDDMIDVSMIDNNLLSLHFQPVWINRILQVIQHEFEGIVRERRLELQVRPFPGCSEMTFGDDERLFQAFRNVISNAIKYTPDGGRIIVDGRKLPGFLEVVVKDTGIGIDPDDHSRIFEKFGRVGSVSLHSSGKTKFKGGGPGLGLPITKGIIEGHGGAIWVESDGYNEDKCPGSTFHILLPLLREPPDTKAARLFGPLIEAEERRTVVEKDAAAAQTQEIYDQEIS